MSIPAYSILTLVGKSVLVLFPLLPTTNAQAALIRLAIQTDVSALSFCEFYFSFIDVEAEPSAGIAVIWKSYYWRGGKVQKKTESDNSSMISPQMTKQGNKG